MNIEIREGTGNYFFRGRFIVEPSHVNIENLSFGRMAFHGMNPEIEKMAKDERVRMEEAEEARREKDVQDDEMAEFFSSVNSTVAKKFATKRSHEGQKMTPPAASGAPSQNVNDEILQKTQNFLQSMRQTTEAAQKDGSSGKKRKFMKPTDS